MRPVDLAKYLYRHEETGEVVIVETLPGAVWRINFPDGPSYLYSWGSVERALEASGRWEFVEKID